jgi:hypothetical protein
VSNAQDWTLLGMVGVLLGVIGGMLVHQLRLVGDRIDARIHGLETTMDARFDAVDQRFDHLDRDVQAIARVVFPRD